VPALSINGVPIPVALGSWRHEVLGADYEQTLARGVRVIGRTRKRRWRGQVTPRTQEEAEALRGLLSGAGRHWPITSSEWGWSDDGLFYSAASGASYTGGGAKFGGGPYLSSTTVSNAFVEWAGAVPAGSPWSVLWWQRAGPGLSDGWRHRILTSTGGVYGNGGASTSPVGFSVTASGTLRLNSFDTVLGISTGWTASTAVTLGSVIRVVASGLLVRMECVTAGTTGTSAPAWPSAFNATVTDGTVTWKNTGWVGFLVQDIVVLPFAVPAGWVPALYDEHNVRAWSALPKLRASGDFIPQAPRTVIGLDEEGEGLVATLGGSRRNNAERFSFTFQEA
jgi:hypothetical protein